MRSIGLIIVRSLSIFLIVITVVLLVFQLVSYSRIRASLPIGSVIGGVPVGGLDRQTAADRLVKAFSVPIEIRYNEAIIQIRPSSIGFELDLESMLTAADQQRIKQPFWSGFWDFLWGRFPRPDPIPLRTRLSDERVKSYLREEVAIRYDKPASDAIPIPGSTQFQPGDAGTKLDVERASVLINDALSSPTNRVVNLTYSLIEPSRPSFPNLEVLLKQVLDGTGFDGLTEVYLLDLQNYQELNFAYQNGQTIRPNIAFTAASTMKIPIMVSVFKRSPDPVPQNILDQIELMIERSENDPADRLMENALEGNLGPLLVTDDLIELGFENTFLAGYFYPGAPLLKRIESPANRRSDINTNPDIYNQTTSTEIGMLLGDIYQCSTQDGGALKAVFEGQITQDECRSMINYLAGNRIGVLIQAGVPETTQVAHKHGWITESDGLIHAISDAGIVYTPGGNYVLVIFMYHPVQLVFDTANYVMAQLSSAVYNYYNIPFE
ncbi:MAG TPA: serine hydrolase [Anaerolineaceae bacterium]|nr:serine hydrolase [Anaerolineaceae bacterium]